jgi:hypothetical protein
LISVEVARNGSRVLKKNGRFLGSSIDPVREAATWTNKALAQAGARDAFVILGLGSGHHVAELLARRPNAPLIVVENDKDILSEALKICPQIKRSQVVLETDVLKLGDHAVVRDVVGSIYRVCSYGPSFQIDDEFFSGAERFFFGRDKLSFLLLLKTRPEFLAILNPVAIHEIPLNEPVSVKTLQRIFAPQALSSRERRLWRILEELVL